MTMALNEADRTSLLATARETIAAKLQNRPPIYPPYSEAVLQTGGAFVTLHQAGRLRGCIGRMSAELSILETVQTMAQAAAFEDPRFPPLDSSELPTVKLEISVLRPLEPISLSAIQIGVHGVYLRYRGRSAVFLPQVAPEQGWDIDSLLENLCYKAGLAAGSQQQPGAELLGFTALVFSEPQDR